MLTSLSVKNFKSWREIAEMRLAPITGLFGANSSGKTSILQLLLMLKQTADSADRAQVLHLGDERSLVSLGTFPEVTFRNADARSLGWRLGWELAQELKVPDPAKPRTTLFSGRSLGFEATVAENGSGRSFVSRMQYSFEDRLFGMRTPDPPGKYELFADAGDFAFKRTTGRAWPLPPPVKCYGFPDQVRAYFQNAGFLADFELALEECLARIFYLGPLREYPRRQYTWAGAEPMDVGQRGERVVDAMLAARERKIRLSRGKGRKRLTLEECVAEWLHKLGMIAAFSVEAIHGSGNLYQVWVQKEKAGPKVLITDVGFGVSQILPVLALCYYAPAGSTLVLEQPEIHLHPAVQAGLADVFIDAVQTRGIQIIVESHSELLLSRLQRRIAEEKLSSEDAALYFCEVEKGESRLTPLELDLFGNILNYPREFFGDALGEANAQLQAESSRRGSA